MSRFNADQLREILSRPNYTLGHAAVSYPPVAGRLPNTQPKPDAELLPLGANEDEGGGAGRITVRITRVGTKLLDLDNLYGSVKFICDALRYAHLIPEDNPNAINLEVRQRTAKKGETGTLIEIERLG